MDWLTRMNQAMDYEHFNSLALRENDFAIVATDIKKSHLVL